MPELPEVETVKRGMAQRLTDEHIYSVDQRAPALRIPFPANLKNALEGRRFSHFGRRAKYILACLDSGQVLAIHLGMSGRVRLFDERDDYSPGKHDHLILQTGNSGFALNDARRFGMVMLMDEKDMAGHPSFKGLGPEPLDNGFSGPVLAQALAGKKAPVKSALLDQRVVAGLGNIYVCEALYFAGIHPERLSGSLTETETENLALAIKDVLRRAIDAGGSSLRDYRQADGELGYFQHQFAVYGKAGETCPACSGDVRENGCIKKIKQAGRSTFYCPDRQR